MKGNNVVDFVSSNELKKVDIQFSKFGGSSFNPPSNVNAITDYLRAGISKGKKQVVFCSAPGDLTQSFKALASGIVADSHSRAIDGLVTCSDLVGAYLLQHAMEQAEISNKLVTGLENGIITDDILGGAQIKQVLASVIAQHLEEVDVLILPGGQGSSSKGLRWLGKNSSDLSCILQAVAAQQTSCAIHSDVDSVFNADPNVIDTAEPYRYLDYDTVITAASLGAKVLHYNAVKIAKQHNLEIVCRLNRAPFSAGTRIGRYQESSITVTDKRALLLDVDDSDFTRVKKHLAQQNVLAFSSTTLKILSRNQLLIPMAYLNYVDMLRTSLPEVKFEGQRKVVMHLVMGDQVLESMFTTEETLNKDAVSFHYTHTSGGKTAYV